MKPPFDSCTRSGRSWRDVYTDCTLAVEGRGTYEHEPKKLYYP